MAVQPAAPCWAVNPPLGEWNTHFEKYADAIQSAASQLTDDMFDDDRIPVVEDRRCWEVVCPGCRVPIDENDEFGSGCHYDLAGALAVDADLAATDSAGLCDVCANSAALGSVASKDGGLLTLPEAPVRAVRPGRGQLPLFELAEVA